MRITDLKRLHAFGTDIKYLNFWGHHPDRSGKPTTACLSNWYTASFTLDGQLYPTTEHFMMAEKARSFNDPETLSLILTAKDPNTAKRLGRQVHGFSDSTWNRVREDAVFRGNLAKFSQNEALGAFLRATAPAVLVEASPHDTIWGIGLDATDPRARSPLTWKGLNLLGFVLMDVRAALLAKA